MLKPHHRAELVFDLVTEIGADGRNSRTFVSRDHQLDAEIVIKQVAKASLASPDEFFAEAQALYAGAHPNVVQIHYACQDADHVFLAMPYYRNGSVKGLITGRHMTVREIVTVACQVLTGLHNIHAKRLIHFDVKPDNILLSPRGEALLSDFGLAKQMRFSGQADQDRHYTPMIPPEAFRTDRFDATFDIFQMGLTLYRMCVGNEAFHAQLAAFGPGIQDRPGFQFAVSNGRFPDRAAFPPHVPNRLRTIVKKCIEVSPSDRYGSAIEVANALALIDDETLDWRLETTPDRRMWTKNETGTQHSFTINANGSCVLYKSKDGGPPRRVSDGCRQSITEKEAQKLLGSY
ncbi:MAG: serine/threonine-protein kinase [Methylorubrum rhodinum]|uniref:serine/threonine-protein kinase n=1 Tax=Methylorubrum rhodinum TaxID=29428 RepID=UPI003BB00CC7